MTAGILSKGLLDLEFDNDYKSPLTHNLHNEFCKLFDQLGVTKVFIIPMMGPPTIFAWAGLESGCELGLLMPCNNCEVMFNAQNKEHYEYLLKRSSTRTVVGLPGWTHFKETEAAKTLIDRADILFVIWNDKQAPPLGYSFAKLLDKEMIIINPKEYLHEAVTNQAY